MNPHFQEYSFSLEPVRLPDHSIDLNIIKKEEEINEPSGLMSSNREKSLRFAPPNETKTLKKSITINGLYFSPMVKRFVYKLKKAIFYSKFSSLSDEDHEILNDNVFIKKHEIQIPKYIQSRLLTLFYIKAVEMKNLFFRLPVLEPYDNFKLAWDILHFLVLNFLVFWTPIELCFDIILPSWIYNYFFVLFIIDIIVSMNTGYYQNGIMVKDRRMIYKHYLKHFFLWDTVTLIGFGLSIGNRFSFDNRDFSDNLVFFAKLIFFLRFRNFLTIYSHFLDRINSKFNIKDSTLDLINLIYVSVFILHIFACFWYFIGDVYRSEEKSATWLFKLDLINASWGKKYIYSLYWSSVTIMTVGYGDISPQNNLEIAFTIFAIFFGCGVVGYIISAIGNIMQEIYKENQIFKQNLYIMNKYMSRKKITSTLQMKIRQYLRFIWQEELTQNSELEDSIIGKLSKTLKEELFLEANGSILNKHSMFFANFSENMLRALMYQMKEIRFNPEDLIFSEGALDECEIYFIIKGKVQITINCLNRIDKKSRLSLKTLSKGDVFGELGFFTGTHRRASAQSKDFSTMLYIKREDFLRLLEKFPEDYEKYCVIRDQILIDQNFNSINTSCFSCKQFDHLIKDCPLLHYSHIQKQRSIRFILLDNNLNTRENFNRKPLKSINSRLHHREILKKTIDFQDYPIRITSFEMDSDGELPEEYEWGETDSTEKKNLNIQSNFIKNDNTSDKRKSVHLMLNSIRNINNEPNFFKNGARNSFISEESNLKVYFEKVYNFKCFYPEFNLKNMIKNNFSSQKKMNNRKSRNKLQKYFLQKEKLKIQGKNPSSVKSARWSLFNHQKAMIFPEKQEKIEKIENSHDITSPTKFFGIKKKTSFYDLVYEVLTNEELRKKLGLIKSGINKMKKSRNKMKLFKY